MDEAHWYQLKSVVGDVAYDTFLSLKRYEAMVRHWQPHINLVAPGTLADLWSRHILDSVQLWPLVRQVQRAHHDVGDGATKDDISWLDLGSGGGFPGLVIAILMQEAGRGSIILVESNGKKAAFLRQVAAQMQLPAVVLDKRIEASSDFVTAVDIITARALAPLPKLFAMMMPYFSPHTKALLQKGRERAQEIEQAQHGWDFSLHQHVSLVDPQSVILEIAKLKRRFF